MLLNYILLSFRNLKKQRGYSIVNALGLAIGLASALFIFLYVQDELFFDHIHPQSENTSRLGYKLDFPNGESEAYPSAPAGWDNYLKDNYEGITEITSFTNTGMPTSIEYAALDKIVLSEDIIWAESNLNKLVYVDVIKGSPTHPLKELNSMLLSESAAYELFGKEDPLNKSLSISHAYMTNGQKVEMMVTGIYKDVPANSHIRPKYIANILSLKPFIPEIENLLTTSMGEGNNNFWTQSFFNL
jgi:putative ABC transport system permease protein